MFQPMAAVANMPPAGEQTQSPSKSAGLEQRLLSHPPDYARKAFGSYHQHHLSDSTATTASSDSSPTTTISTADSSTTEISPGSSPESPPPSTFATAILRSQMPDDGAKSFFELQKQAPPKKGRNLKNLAVNTSRNLTRGASFTSLPLQSASIQDFTQDPAPSFVKPLHPPKRKTVNAGLTLMTPAVSTPPPQEIKLPIPPSPAVRRARVLRRFQSSPSLPFAPHLSPHHAMPGPRNRIQTNLEIIPSPSKSHDEREEQDRNFDVPLSKEEKPEAYPDGPICVYEPSIDLYLEPTAQQARQYDVIMNVASEVRNPFLEYTEADPTADQLRIDGGGGIQHAPKRDAHIALGCETEESSPETPKATPLTGIFDTSKSVLRKDPEYIHMKWEHNSDIVPDLLRLVKLIDEKVVQGKRVLIHCQCGVSRSASLIVAYGLYKDPTLSVQQAYDAVKKKSKWIGPNMNLIMQLQEFRSSLMNGGRLPDNRCISPISPNAAFREWKAASPATPADATLNGLVDSPAAAPSFPCQPEPCPAAMDGQWAAAKPSFVLDQSVTSSTNSNTALVNPPSRPSDSIPEIVQPDSITPTGAVSDVPPHIDEPAHTPTNSASATLPELALRPLRPSPEAVTGVPAHMDEPARTPTNSASATLPDLALTPLQPSPEMDSADDFGIMSPTATEFQSSPFDRSALLAHLGMDPVRQNHKSPRRSTSLKFRRNPCDDDRQSGGDSLRPARRLRCKVSLPSLGEQQRLQSLQARIESSHPHRHYAMDTTPKEDVEAEALMSPRATEFTQNPFAMPVLSPSPAASPPPPPDDVAPNTLEDPRSPAHNGLSPIVRNIFNVL